MSKIAEFLTHFDDQHLANLQCAAEDGRLVFMDACNCLLSHFRGQYSETKWDPEIGPLAREAESQFLRLGGHEPDTMKVGPNGEWRVIIGSTKGGDPDRRLGILPMIHAEWARRNGKMHHQINEIDELQTVSPNLR